ncbi:MAG: ornithine carbamoyltransferase [Acidobacteriota bacterium]
MFGKDLVSIHDLSSQDIRKIFDLALKVKATPENYRNHMSHKTLAMVFEKPSLRTRVTFEAGMTQMGGHAIYLGPNDIQLGKRETVPDVARNLERWVDVIMARTFSHGSILQLAEYAHVPVINALSDRLHPCQALADFLTLLEKKGTLEGRTLAFVGDGNNVAHSLMYIGAKTGVNVRVVCPEGFDPAPDVLKAAQEDAAATGAEITVVHDLKEGVGGADAVYTDVWASMGQESEAEKRKKIFQPYQVNAQVMALADKEAIFMHCLPAHRGEEVTSEVVDSWQSVVFDEAENRLHAQKAAILLLCHEEMQV